MLAPACGPARWKVRPISRTHRLATRRGLRGRTAGRLATRCAGRGARPDKIDPAGQPPFRFQIAYNDATLLPGRRYVVRATVRHQGQLLFTTNRAYPLVQGGDSAPLKLLLVSTGAGRRPSQAAPREARLELTGMFAYMADTPSDRDRSLWDYILCLDQARHRPELSPAWTDRHSPTAYNLSAGTIHIALLRRQYASGAGAIARRSRSSEWPAIDWLVRVVHLHLDGTVLERRRSA